MHDILKDRVWRKLESLPQEQVYQVLDYIEFLEGKYAREQAIRADPIQRFAERLEDGMRIRSVAPKVITGTVGLLGTARRVLRTVSDAGRDILDASQPAPKPATGRSIESTTSRPAERPRAPERPNGNVPADRAPERRADEPAEKPTDGEKEDQGST